MGNGFTKVFLQVSEWSFRRLEAGSRAMVVPVALLEGRTADVPHIFKFVEFGYEGRGTDVVKATGREIELVVDLVTFSSPGMAGGYVLVEFEK